MGRPLGAISHRHVSRRPVIGFCSGAETVFCLRSSDPLVTETHSLLACPWRVQRSGQLPEDPDRTVIWARHLVLPRDELHVRLITLSGEGTEVVMSDQTESHAFAGGNNEFVASQRLSPLNEDARICLAAGRSTATRSECRIGIRAEGPAPGGSLTASPRSPDLAIPPVRPVRGGYGPDPTRRPGRAGAAP